MAKENIKKNTSIIANKQSHIIIQYWRSDCLEWRNIGMTIGCIIFGK